MYSIEKKRKPVKLVKPNVTVAKHKVQAYTTESGNPGCVECRSGCYNCGCRKSCT